MTAGTVICDLIGIEFEMMLDQEEDIPHIRLGVWVALVQQSTSQDWWGRVRVY